MVNTITNPLEKFPSIDLTESETKIRDIAIEAMLNEQIPEAISEIITIINEQGWIVEYGEHPYGVDHRNAGKFFPNSKRIHVLKTDKLSRGETEADLRESELREFVHEYCMAVLVQKSLEESDGDLYKATRLFQSGYIARLEVDEQVDTHIRDENRRANTQFGAKLKRDSLQDPDQAFQSARNYLENKLADEKRRQNQQEWWDKINA